MGSDRLHHLSEAPPGIGFQSLRQQEQEAVLLVVREQVERSGPACDQGNRLQLDLIAHPRGETSAQPCKLMQADVGDNAAAVCLPGARDLPFELHSEL